MPKAYSYIRFSTPEQSKGDSYRRQLEMARRYADSHGLELDETLTFEDLGVSAFRGQNAETGALSRFVRAVQDGVIESDCYLLVENLDRISRAGVFDAQTAFMNIIQSGVILVTLGDDKVYSRDTMNKNPTDLIFSIVILMRGNNESSTKSQRGLTNWSKKRDVAITDGRPMTAICPAWLRLSSDRARYEIIEDRAEVVKRVYELASGGMGLLAIAQKLNREKVPTFGSSAAWGRSFILKLLRSEAPVGRFTPHVIDMAGGKKIRVPTPPIDGYFPSIMDADLWTAGRKEAQALVRGAHPAAHYLSGIAVCAKCGVTLTRKTYGSGPKAGKPKLVHADKDQRGIGSCDSPNIPVALVETALRQQAEHLTALDAQEGEEAAYEVLWNAESTLDAAQVNLEAVALSVGTTPGGREALRIAQDQYDRALERHVEALAAVEAATSPIFKSELEDLRVALKASAPPSKVNGILRRAVKAVSIDWYADEITTRWRNGRETTIHLGNALLFLNTPIVRIPSETPLAALHESPLDTE